MYLPAMDFHVPLLLYLELQFLSTTFLRMVVIGLFMRVHYLYSVAYFYTAL